MNQERFAVQHRSEESRYVLLDLEADPAADPGADPGVDLGADPGMDGGEPRVIGEEDYVDLTDGGRAERVFFHTGVSDAYAGQGLGSRLVRGAVEHATREGYAIVPVCPYVAAWLPKHPEFAEHAVEPRQEHLDAVRDAQKQ